MREKHPLFKEISGWKSNTPPFFTFLGPDFVARKIPLYRTFWQHAWGHFETWVGGRAYNVSFTFTSLCMWYQATACRIGSCEGDPSWNSLIDFPLWFFIMFFHKSLVLGFWYYLIHKAIQLLRSVHNHLEPRFWSRTEILWNSRFSV